MISGKQLLPILIGVAVGSAGWMRHGKPPQAMPGVNVDGRIAMLEKENASLRSLAQGGGEVAVPPEMIAQVEKNYGLSFLSSPVFHRIAAEELGYRIEASIESSLGPQGAEDRQEAWRWMGLLKPGDNLLELLVAVKSVGAVGWFDEGTGDAWVTDRFEMENIPDQAVMLRLLVRILLNQNFPPPPAYPGDDAFRAREALHAGAAKGAESRFYAASARGIGFMPMNEGGPAARLMLALPDFLRGLAAFPGLEGRGLADSLYVKGVAEFADGMRDVPKNTLEVVLPSRKGNGVEPDFSEIEDEVYLKESAGYLGLRLWLSRFGGEDVAKSWTGDGYVLFADGEMSSGLLWEVNFANGEASEKFLKAAQIWAGEMAEEGRFRGVIPMSDTSVRIYNVATEETAKSLREKS